MIKDRELSIVIGLDTYHLTSYKSDDFFFTSQSVLFPNICFNPLQTSYSSYKTHRRKRMWRHFVLYKVVRSCKMFVFLQTWTLSFKGEFCSLWLTTGPGQLPECWEDFVLCSLLHSLCPHFISEVFILILQFVCWIFILLAWE